MVSICRYKLSHTVECYYLESIRGHPILVGDPRFGLGIPELVRGSPNQNGDARRKNPRTDLEIPKPIQGSPNQNGDP